MVLKYLQEPTITQLCKVLVQQLLSCEFGEVIIIKWIPRGDIGWIIDVLLWGPWGTRGRSGSRSGCDHSKQTTVINNPPEILWPASWVGLHYCIIITILTSNTQWQVLYLHTQNARTSWPYLLVICLSTLMSGTKTIKVISNCSCRRPAAIQQAWSMRQSYWWDSWLDSVIYLKAPFAQPFGSEETLKRTSALGKFFSDFLPSPTLWSWGHND